MQQQLSKKIVIIGPESTGKSTLCNQLAVHYQTIWCKEFAREYLLNIGKNYTYLDLENIAQGQIKSENFCFEITKENKKPLFLDTNLWVIKVWAEFVFDKCQPTILQQIATQQYDGYLLCNIDLPWVKDELREYPNEKPRQQLMAMYKDILINQNLPWHIVSGSNNNRLASAISFLDSYIF
jgi:NadR type nicotinamide-nucleotide adenylyltransferase